MRSLKPILLVEDDSIDVMTVRRAFKDLKVTNPIAHACDGEQALDYLRNKSNEKPCVILLDLNMPKMNGTEFLKVAKNDDVLKKIPVVVLTTSREKCDIVESFNLGVAGYIVKRVDYQKFVNAIRIIKLYWALGELPKQNSGVEDVKLQRILVCNQ